MVMKSILGEESLCSPSNNIIRLNLFIFYLERIEQKEKKGKKVP
jgi:hypothetical protein